MSQAIQIAHNGTANSDKALTRHDSLSDWASMREQAQTLVRSGFLPRSIDTPEKAIAIMMTGRELGLGPMQALRSIHIVEGKPTMAAELIAGLVLARVPGALLRVVQSTNDSCEVHAARPGQDPTVYRFTTQDAQRAGLTGKSNWKSYPAAMLRARCLAAAARATFPDATMGLYDPDELGAVTTATGEIASGPRGQSVAATVANSEPFEEPSTGSPFQGLLHRLEGLESAIATACSTYDDALSIRAELGSKAKQSQLLRELQDASGKGNGPRTITAEEYRQLSSLWQRCDRQLAKRERELTPSAEEALSGDLDEDPEAVLRASRQRRRKAEYGPHADSEPDPDPGNEADMMRDLHREPGED